MNKKTKGNKALHIVIDVLVILVLIISALVLISTLTAKATGGLPNIFGKAFIGVQTNSMHGDNPDSFDEGDLIICDCVKEVSPSAFKEGDVVTFMQDLSGEGVKSQITHRIFKVNEDGSYLTKGDNNGTFDQDKHNAIVFPNLQYYDVLATYSGARIPNIGYAVNFIQTSVGFFWCILFPMILFFLYQAVRVVINAMAYSKEKGLLAAQEAIDKSGLTEEQKQKAIAEYLATHNIKESDISEKAPPETQETQDPVEGEEPSAEGEVTAENTSEES